MAIDDRDCQLDRCEDRYRLMAGWVGSESSCIILLFGSLAEVLRFSTSSVDGRTTRRWRSDTDDGETWQSNFEFGPEGGLSFCLVWFTGSG